MKPSIILALFLLPAPALAQRLEMVSLNSRVFGNTRTLRVLLPPGYDAPATARRRYPVLYLNDGQNLFDSTTSMFNPMEWRVDETVAALVAARAIGPMIVVGIDNAGRSGRFHEYFPWFDQYLQPPDSNPQGSRYPEFLIDEVMPLVNARFRTLTGPRNTGLGGSSAGALAALYTAVTRPGVVGRLLIESPSLYVDDDRIMRMSEGVASWPARVYLGAGTNESNQAACDTAAAAPGEAGLASDVRRLATIMRAARRPPSVRVLITPCGRHDEAAWAARLPEALTFLYRR